MAQYPHILKEDGSTSPDVLIADEPVDILKGLLHASAGLVAVSETLDISFLNKAFLDTMNGEGLEPEAVIGKAFGDVFRTADLPKHPSVPVDKATGTNAQRQPNILWSPNPAGGWIGVAAKHHDRSVNSALLYEPDELTGLGNRKHLKACFDRMAKDASRRNGGIVALFLDLDHFKQVNDTLGHAVGDRLLSKVAERLKKTVRQEDVVARIGGDEFAILLSDKSSSAAEDIAARIVKMISRPFLIDSHQLTIGVSIGLAAWQHDERDAERLLQRADIALYQSKRSGRNQFSWFEEEMLAELAKRREIEIDLRKALLLGQFKIVFQPQVNFERQQVSGFEALIRWAHPEHGEIAPLDFIGIAEETGIMIDIGTWVLGEACKAAATWPEDIAVAVNVSSLEFEDDGFIEVVRSALQTSGLAPHRLELEITETTLLKYEELVLDRMNDLRSLGVRISLDDFGIGYSSLNYLRKYPFDKVKIDQSFVREPFADANAHQIVEAVAQLGTAFGMNVLAEGVETAEQLARIRANGCASTQGYLIGRPINATEIDAFLKAPPAAIQRGTPFSE